MQKLRIIIGAIVLISGVFFAVMSLIGTLDSTIKVIAIGVIFIGGLTWFLMQMQDPQRPKEEAQKTKKDIHQKPFAKEDELIEYIRTNVLISNTCSTRRYNNKNINLEALVHDLSKFYDGHFSWSKPTRIQFDDVIAIANDESIVVFIKGVNNLVVKVHVPIDESDVESGLARASVSPLGNVSEDELIDGGSFGRINPGLALRKALRGKDATLEALNQLGRRLEGSIAKYIDDRIRNNRSSQQSESLDMIYMRNLRNWRT